MVMEAIASDTPSKLRYGPRLAMRCSLWIKEGSGIAGVREGFMRIHMGTYTCSYSKLFNN
jgi:hypothetical protein